MPQRIIGSVVLLAAVFCGGCASILSDSTYPVTVSSNVEGARVKVTNKNGQIVHQGTAPTTVSLPASDGFFQSARYTVDFEKEGYLKTQATSQATMDGWYIGNIIFGGLIGLILVDPATGAMWKLDGPVNGNLEEDPDFRVTDAVAKDDGSGGAGTPAQSGAPEQTGSGAGDVAAEAVSPQEESGAEDINRAENRLQTLKDMHEQGLITDKEYEVKRQETVEAL
jgi:hypothetical protein